MTQFPYLSTGRMGNVTFRHLNRIMDVVDRETVEEYPILPDDAEGNDALFIAKILGRSNVDDPFNVLLSWDEQYLDEAGDPDGGPQTPPDDFHYHEGPRSSTGRVSGQGVLGRPPPPPDEFAEPAIYLMPPQGLMLIVPSEKGPNRQVWFPAPSVLHGVIVEITSGAPFNTTYTATSIDESIVANEVSPIDRWASTDYLPKSIGDPCLLLLNKEQFDIHGIPLPNQVPISMVAWETPDFEQCAGGAAASGGGFSFGVNL